MVVMDPRKKRQCGLVADAGGGLFRWDLGYWLGRPTDEVPGRLGDASRKPHWRIPRPGPGPGVPAPGPPGPGAPGPPRGGPPPPGGGPITPGWTIGVPGVDIRRGGPITPPAAPGKPPRGGGWRLGASITPPAGPGLPPRGGGWRELELTGGPSFWSVFLEPWASPKPQLIPWRTSSGREPQPGPGYRINHQPHPWWLTTGDQQAGPPRTIKNDGSVADVDSTRFRYWDEYFGDLAKAVGRMFRGLFGRGERSGGPPFSARHERGGVVGTTGKAYRVGKRRSDPFGVFLPRGPTARKGPVVGRELQDRGGFAAAAAGSSSSSGPTMPMG